MSIWRDFFEGFTEGALTVAAYQAVSYSRPDRGRIDRLCRELGWAVDERDGNVIYLHFNNSSGIRRVRITDGDEALVTYSTHSFAVVPAKDVRAEVLAYLLSRNLTGSGIGMWGMHVDAENDVMFLLMYQALGNGLDAATLKWICESLCSEAADFDARMRQSGQLR